MNVLYALWDRVRLLRQRIAEGHARRRAIRDLSGLSDWQLEDIGVERGRIPEIVDNLYARQREAERSRRRADGVGTARGLDPARATEAPV